MQIGFYFDQTRCTGCGACIVACEDWHDVPAGPVKWIRVLYSERGEFPEVFVSHIVAPCYHCVSPLCIPACPVKAISKREEDGIVVVDREACLGNVKCKVACLKACPYDAPQFGPEPDAKMEKCDLCLERWGENRKPVCIEACPTRALDAGPLDELEAKYGNTREADAFAYSEKTMPSVIFKPKRWEPGVETL
ncbi:MAG: 4Fe-4S dicluster domain-containing protein [Dehalococcoidia bacterium]|nr:4Fe-4S dicluster domain-containing protein [Dehalococcoidia bacterium]